jgi:hypothetical protein
MSALAYKQLVVNTKIHIDVLASIMDSEHLPKMLSDTEKQRDTIIDDYEKLKTPQVKEIALEQFHTINANIRTIKFLIANQQHMSIALERLGN